MAPRQRKGDRGRATTKESRKTTDRPARVAFVHPDLGLGGAERLVVDAAVALQRYGHSVTVFTSHHEPDRCFTETCDGTLDVRVYGDWMPRHIFGRGHALFAYLRMIYTALAVVLTFQADVVICDQVSACIPVFRWLTRARVLFYCHFPDMLLTQRQSRLKKMYRGPIDWLEETTTGMADIVMVNSKFTAATFHETFKRLAYVQPQVLYPSLDFSAFDKDVKRPHPDELIKSDVPHVFLSINRFERKKNLLLALEALLVLRQNLENPKTAGMWDKVHLVMAGGYDPRLEENVSYFAELENFAQNNGLEKHVTFIRSFSDDEKLVLLRRCCALVYTPANEHFGICPLEAMYMQKPVIAVNSGGPMETVCAAGGDPVKRVRDQTGFLCEQTPFSFAAAMLLLVKEPSLERELGDAGRSRVEKMFSFAAFSAQLNDAVQALF